MPYKNDEFTLVDVIHYFLENNRAEDESLAVSIETTLSSMRRELAVREAEISVAKQALDRVVGVSLPSAYTDGAHVIAAFRWEKYTTRLEIYASQAHKINMAKGATYVW